MIVTEAELRLVLGLSSTITDEERGVLLTVHKEAEQAVRRYLGYDPEQAERTEFLPRGDYLGTAYGAWESTGAYAVWTPADIVNELLVAHIPIRSISSLRVDRDGRFGTRAGSFGAETAWTEGVDFWPTYEASGVCKSGLIQASTSWPVSAGSVRITYTAGLTAAELSGNTTNRIVDGSGISEAVKLTAVKGMETYMTRRKKTRLGWIPGALASETLGSYSYSTDSAALSAAVGMLKKLPPQAEQACADWRHYGIMAL